MNWNNLYSQIASIRDKAIVEIGNLLPKIENHKDFDKESGFLQMEEMEMLIDGEMRYVDSINKNRIIQTTNGYETDIYALDVYDLVYLGEQLDFMLNGTKE